MNGRGIKGDPLATPAAYQMAAWTLRLAESDAFRWLLADDPHLFALLYATCAAAVSPPPRLAAGEAQDLPEQLLPALKDLRRQLGHETTGRFARLYLRGVTAFTNLLLDDDARHGALYEWRAAAEARAGEVVTAQEQNVDRLADLLGLRPIERDLLNFQLNVHRPGFSQVFDLLMDSDHALEMLLSVALGVPEADVLDALADTSTLISSGLLNVERRPLSVSEPSAHLRATLSEPAPDFETLMSRFLEPLEPSPSTASLARLDRRDRDLLLRLVRAPLPGEHGIHVLVYGPTSIDKRDMLATLFRDEGVRCHAVVMKRVPLGDLAAWVHIAQKHLERADPESVLVVDRAHDALASRRRSVFNLFGIEEDDDELEVERASDRGLTGRHVRCVWLTDDARRLSEPSLGAFLFHCEALPGSRTARRERVTQVVSEHRLSDRLERQLAKYRLLGEQQVRQATRLAALVAPSASQPEPGTHRAGSRPSGLAKGAGGAAGRRHSRPTPLDREGVIERAVAQSQRALGRDHLEELRESITKYDLDLLNISGRFKPEQIINALRVRQKGSLLFWGIPGAGKTQLAEHIAVELDLPLMMRSASDLLSKWVGETEQRLAAMFKEATDEGAMLLLDEADSFLRDRTLARAEWYVSQVNELLQKMERFEGIFVAATNLADSVDAAAMRRFTWKLEFKALASEQAWSMFCSEAQFDEADDPQRAVKLRDELSVIPDLAPGDFATVKRQAEMLGEQLSPEAWLEQLSTEAKAKMAGLRRQKLGFAA